MGRCTGFGWTSAACPSGLKKGSVPKKRKLPSGAGLPTFGCFSYQRAHLYCLISNTLAGSGPVTNSGLESALPEDRRMDVRCIGAAMEAEQVHIKSMLSTWALKTPQEAAI